MGERAVGIECEIFGVFFGFFIMIIILWLVIIANL